MRRSLDSSILPGIILALASALGAWAFLSPFFAPSVPQEEMMGMAHANDAPLFFVLLLGLCLLLLVTNLETRKLDAQLVAVLGVIIGINATLRLIPGIAGFSAVFFLPILCGYVFGASFGFLVGSLSLLVSALITGGIGPWLPFQMFACGWNGMVAGWIPQFTRNPRLEVGMLAVWGFFSGFLFGAIMNLWFWPFFADPSGTSFAFTPGAGAGSTLVIYGLFYVATSFLWDAWRAVGNALLIVLLGIPILRLLRRFYARFHFTATDSPALPAPSEPVTES
jgi:energy-coupling factor transport system substrate-specific component